MNTKNKDSRELTSFRIIQSNDSTKLYNFFESLSKKSKKTFSPHPFTLEFAQRITKESSSEKRLKVVAISNSKIVGYGFLHRLPLFSKNAYFGIAISDSFQGQGIGSRLLSYLLNYGQKKGVTCVYLNVYESNKKAISVYEKIGFVQIESSHILKLFTLNELIYTGELVQALTQKKSKANPEPVTWMKKELS